MLASSAFSGKFADPTTIEPPAAADPEADAFADPEAAAAVVSSGLPELPQADTVSRAARPAASSPALLISDTDFSLLVGPTPVAGLWVVPHPPPDIPIVRAATRSAVGAAGLRPFAARPVSPGDTTKCPMTARIRSPSTASSATRNAPATIIE